LNRNITVSDDEQALLDDSASQFFRDLTTAGATGVEACGYRPEVLAQMAQLGWTGWLVPTAYGGTGLGLRSGRVLHEHFGRAAVTEPMLELAVLAVGVLREAPAGALRDALLAGIAQGRLRVALSWRNRGAASLDAVSGRLRASGVFEHASPADADVFLVPIRGELLRIPRDRPGVSVAASRRTDGGLWATVTLDAVGILPEDRLASRCEPMIDAALDGARVMASAELLGAMQAGLDETLAYLRIREQFGVPIGSFQALQHRAADQLVAVELSRAAVDRACAAFDAAEDRAVLAREASGALARCATAATDVLKACVQMHGGIGYTEDARIGRLFRRALVLSVALDTAPALRARFLNLARRTPTRIAGGPAGAHDPDELGFDPDVVRAVIEREYPERLRRLGRRASWREAEPWQRALHARGWSAPAWPTEYGGMGLSAYAQVVWSELFDSAGVNIVPNIGVSMLGPLLIRHGTPQQRATHLPRILEGGTYWCQGYSEPEAGSDLASLRTAARLEGDTFVIDGRKIWTSLAFEADWMFVLARTDPPAPKHAGISFLLVDMSSPGITVTPIRNLSGTSEFCQVFLDGVRVPAHNLVGPLNGGWRMATSLLGSERIALGSPRYVRRSLAMLRRLAEARGAFDDPVFADRYASHRLDVDHFEALYIRTVDALRRGADVSADTSLLKLVVSETWQRIADETRLLAGADGVAVEPLSLADGDPLPVLNDFLVSRSATIYGGTSEIQRNILAKAWLDLPAGATARR
jgi:alkylation response protein AidB-like acyl-CoA dehydrogenase